MFDMFLRIWYNERWRAGISIAYSSGAANVDHDSCEAASSTVRCGSWYHIFRKNDMAEAQKMDMSGAVNQKEKEINRFLVKVRAEVREK